MGNSKIKKIVLTGGPCGGKTEILGDIEKHLTEKGYYVITIPETATQLIKSKMYPCMDEENVLMFQDIVLKFQLMKEQQAERYAREKLFNKEVIILCDRAIMDNRVYLNSQNDFEKILKENGLDELNVLHGYDMVIDLISTASYMKEKYKLDGVREEPVDVAADLDKKTTMAWSMHPNLCIFKPMETIEEKSNLVIEKINEFLNKVDYNTRDKVLINDVIDLTQCDFSDCRVLDIVKLYLNDDFVVTNKKCDGTSVLLLGKSDGLCDDIIISEDDLKKLLYKYPCSLTESFKEISFVDDGNLYKIVNSGNKYYFDYDKKVFDSNNDNAVNCINKTFVKQKKTC